LKKGSGFRVQGSRFRVQGSGWIVAGWVTPFRFDWLEYSME
jgi:hypothetical protein